MSQSRLYLTARKPEAFHINSILEQRLEEDGVPVSLFEEDEGSGQWVVSIYVETQHAPAWRVKISDVLGSDGFGLKFNQEDLDDINWVEHTLSKLVPVRAGRFLVHGSHDRHAAKPNDIAIEVDAGLAFGTGHHGTTAGCLDMIGKCLKRHKFRNALDLGTGSGVLAIGLAKAAKIPVLATDIDPVSITVTRENVHKNGCDRWISAKTAPGFTSPVFARHGPFDLVVANILARPLQSLAAPMARHLAPEATVILSGLLPHQKARIVSAYRAQGLILRHFHIRDGWLTLVLQF